MAVVTAAEVFGHTIDPDPAEAMTQLPFRFAVTVPPETYGAVDNPGTFSVHDPALDTQLTAGD